MLIRLGRSYCEVKLKTVILFHLYETKTLNSEIANIPSLYLGWNMLAMCTVFQTEQVEITIYKSNVSVPSELQTSQVGSG